MTNTIQVRKAKREKLIAAVQIAGPSGAGKTLGGLLMAYGMMKEAHPDFTDEQLWDKIGLVDTEHERSLVYEGMEKQDVKIGQFLFVPLDKPYTVSRYNQAVKAIKDAGAEVVVIDSISHAWDQEGGLLDLQTQKGGNFQAWREINPVYAQFIDLATGHTHRIHTISTTRSKQEYAMEQSETGKLSVKKLGLKQVQRDNLEYEFQIVFNVDMDHIATTSKDNSGLFEGVPAKLGPDHGKKLIQWLEKGIDVKGKEEEDRQEFIKHTRGLANFRSELDDKLKELEKLAKQPLEAFDLRLAERAFGILNKTMTDLEAAESEIKAAQAQ
jgi:hypothetical protein